MSGASETWRQPLFLRSYFGLLIHAAADGSLTAAEADLAPKTVVIAESARLGWRVLRLRDGGIETPTSAEIRATLRDAAAYEILDGFTVEPVPGEHMFAFRKDARYLSAGRRGELAFVSPHRKSWEMFSGIRPGPLAYRLWRPGRTMGGTQLMFEGLRDRMGTALDAINLQLHKPDTPGSDSRPLVIWLHNDAHSYYDWCHDARRVDRVAAFVFVSDWQRGRFLAKFPALSPARCHVIRNATDADAPERHWQTDRPWRYRCAYTSAPDRGLSVLLDSWERLDRADAELHIWSSFRLWGPRYSDQNHNAMFARAERLPGVIYHGIRPNGEIRAALREMHFLTYPCTLEETACIAVMEAMVAGVRVVTPALAGLSETTAGFARLYSHTKDAALHAERFAELLAEEFARPWEGHPQLALAQQTFARQTYDWLVCVEAWRRLIAHLLVDRGA